MILTLHDVIGIVLLLEGKPMGAVNAFTCGNLSLPTFFDLVMVLLMFLYCN